MGGTWAAPGGEPAGHVLPAAGWYWCPDPEGRGTLRWWDGTAWAEGSLWPAPAQARSAGPARVSAWLASPAASPLFAAVAAVTAIGWAGAAAVMAAAAAAGKPVLAAGTVDLSGFVLAAADVLAWSGALVYRISRAQPAGPAAAARAMRPTARRARRASSGLSVAVQAVGLLVLWHRRVFASLPRPVAWFFAAAAWATAGAFAWAIFEVESQPQLWWLHLGTTAAGQQLAAVVWMTHLIAWSGIAVRRLDRTRAAARMMPGFSVGSR
jgi:hypothetical protein